MKCPPQSSVLSPSLSQFHCSLTLPLKRVQMYTRNGFVTTVSGKIFSDKLLNSDNSEKK